MRRKGERRQKSEEHARSQNQGLSLLMKHSKNLYFKQTDELLFFLPEQVLKMKERDEAKEGTEGGGQRE